jgi:hypothetical protein
MNRDQIIAEIGRLVVERQRIEAELAQTLGSVGKRRGRPPGSWSKHQSVPSTSASALKSRASRKRRGLTKGSLGFKIVDVLKHSAKVMNAKAVAVAIGEKRVPMVATTLYRLQRTGYLKRAGRGKYRAG